MNLLTYSQQQEIKEISPNNESKYPQIAKEVEEVELRDLLGVALLQDVQDNPGSATNVSLLDGSTFTDCNNNTVKQKGIRYILAYFNYAKYIGQSDVSDSFSGMVRKTRDESEPLSEGTIKRLQLESRKVAMREWELVKMFLDENYTDYPLWTCAGNKQPFNPRFTLIRKTKN